MQAFLDAFLSILTPYLILVALGGVSLGIVWGALPGLSTTMAMALLIGLSAGMEQNTAIVFMLGVYTGSVFGGAISAVLINIPGTPDAVPTMIEGHQLAQRGEGGQALGMTIVASFIGNWIGIFLLIAFIPAILAIALNFKSWEMFLLTVIGITICGSMTSGEAPIKGWISGAIGLLIAFVGVEPIYGVMRFTYGVPELIDGVGYIPVLIGLFGIAEILRTLPRSEERAIPTEVGRIIPPFSRLRRHVKAALRSGLIGTIIGAIPGAGANVASFLAYDIGRRCASTEEQAKWGKGSYEAVTCAEVANNANIGGSMLPMLTLGIPGNAAVTAFMAALLLKNVVVGPNIQTDNPDIIYFIYAALIVANFLMYFAAIALIKPCVKLFSLPRGLLMVLILPICVMGAYAVRLNPFDVWVMLAAGVIGFVFTLFRFPVAPLVLSMILAPLADDNLRRSLLVFADQSIGFVLSQYLGTFLLVCIAAILVEGMWRVWRERRVANIGAIKKSHQ